MSDSGFQPGPVRRPVGLETEFGILRPGDPYANPVALSSQVVEAYCTAADVPAVRWDYEGEDPLADLRGGRLQRSVAHPSQLTDDPTRPAPSGDAPPPAPWGSRARPSVAEAALPHAATAVLVNGARLYVDHAHPEYSSPEVLTPRDAVVWDRAGELIARRAMIALTEGVGGAPSGEVVLYKNNVDGKGATYGSHENYLVRRDLAFSDLAPALIPFLVTRPVIAGAGRVGIGQRSQRPGFQMSQRADYVESDVGLQTTFNRPIVNTRDEPHADESKYRRLHVIPADANLSHYSNLLKFGTAALVMNLIESHSEQTPVLPGVRLSDPVAAMHAVSHDVSLSVQLPLAPSSATLPNPVSTSGYASALQIQRAYYEASRAHEESNPAGVDAETAQILDLWGEVLDALETNPLSLADRLDWVAKYALVRGYVAQGVDYANPKLKALDLQYADIDPSKSLYHRLVARGRMRTLFSAEQVERATTEPPRETRAFLRGTLMARWPEEILGINWDTVSCRGRYSKDLTRFTMMEPTRYGAAEVEPLLDEVNHSDELLNRLR